MTLSALSVDGAGLWPAIAVVAAVAMLLWAAAALLLAKRLHEYGGI